MNNYVDFCNWLKGCLDGLETANFNGLNYEAFQLIQENLDKVFKYDIFTTPNIVNDATAKYLQQNKAESKDSSVKTFIVDPVVNIDNYKHNVDNSISIDK